MALDSQTDYSHLREPRTTDIEQPGPKNPDLQLNYLERQRLSRAAQQARALWPNKFGEWVASELNSMLGIGLRFDSKGSFAKMLVSLDSMYLDQIGEADA